MNYFLWSVLRDGIMNQSFVGRRFKIMCKASPLRQPEANSLRLFTTDAIILPSTACDACQSLCCLRQLRSLVILLCFLFLIFPAAVGQAIIRRRYVMLVGWRRPRVSTVSRFTPSRPPTFLLPGKPQENPQKYITHRALPFLSAPIM